MECLKRVLVSIDGEAVGDVPEALSCVRPTSLRLDVINELIEVSKEMANLDPKACCAFVERYGSDTTS